MLDGEKLLEKRFSELSARAFSRGIRQYSDFLSLADQDILLRQKLQCRVILAGGFETAERRIACFEPPDCDYEEYPPITCICIEPLSQKFADKLSHRDFLGSLMNLGIEREMLGDIVIINNVGYLFAKEEICEYICSSLTKIKHTDVKVSTADSLPDGELYRTEMRKIQLSSERLDAVVAKTFSLSRDDAQALFKRGLIFVNGKCIENTSYTPKAGEVVSARGHGRLIYRGYDSTSKKGKLNVSVELYV